MQIANPGVVTPNWILNVSVEFCDNPNEVVHGKCEVLHFGGMHPTACMSSCLSAEPRGGGAGGVWVAEPPTFCVTKYFTGPFWSRKRNYSVKKLRS